MRHLIAAAALCLAKTASALSIFEQRERANRMIAFDRQQICTKGQRSVQILRCTFDRPAAFEENPWRTVCITCTIGPANLWYATI